MRTVPTLPFAQAAEVADKARAVRLCPCGKQLIAILEVDPTTRLIEGQRVAPMNIGCPEVASATGKTGSSMFFGVNLPAYLDRAKFRLINGRRHLRTETVAWYPWPER